MWFTKGGTGNSPKYVCVISVGGGFSRAMFCVLHVAVSVGSVITSRVVGSNRRYVYGDGIVDSILIHCDSIRRGRYDIKQTEGVWE